MITKKQMDLVRQAGGYFGDPTHDAMNALIAIGDKLASGEWVLVPREPTEEMSDAAWRSYAKNEISGPRGMYRAMIDAAQKSPAPVKERG